MRVAGGFVLGIVLIACSDGGSGSVGNGGAATSDSFIDQYCGLLQPCCQQAGLRTDGVACKAFATFAAAQGTYDPQAGDRCITELRAQSATSEFCKNPSLNAASCRNVYASKGSGTKAPGAPCSDDDECAPSAEGTAECVFAGSDKRVCQIQIVGKDGDNPCVGTRDGNTLSSFGTSGADTPARGFVCDTKDNLRCDSKTKNCTLLVAEGAPCTSSDACVKSAFCDQLVTKTCVKRFAPGEDCSKNSTACEKTATCDSSTKKCVALAPDGSPCSTSSGCASRSCVNGTCGAGSSVSLLCGKN